MPSVWDMLDELKNDTKEIADDIETLTEELSRISESEDVEALQEVVRDTLSTLIQIKDRLY